MRLLPFDYAVRNLGRSPTRLLLSVLGSALVVILVMTAAAFVRGMDLSLNISGSPDNIILFGAGSEESIERSEIDASTPSVLEATISGIRARSGTSYVSPQVHVMLPAHTPSQESTGHQLLIRGFTPEALLVHDRVRIVEGRLPVSGSDEILIGNMVAHTLGLAPADLALGSTIMINGKPWKISGRFAAPGTVLEGEAWAPLNDIMAATKRTTISCVILAIDPTQAEFADIDAFTKMRPDLELAATSEQAYYGRLSSFFGPIKFVAWITAALIATGGLFGGLNTMYAAFASRVRELGTLQSFGYRRLAIVTSLVQESLLATTAGSLIACAVSLFFLDSLAVRFSMGTFGLVVDPLVVGIGLCAGFMLGLCGALPPAVRCLRLSIPVALKSF